MLVLSCISRCIPNFIQYENRNDAMGKFFCNLGQIINAAVGPMVMAAPSLLSKVWFPQDERTFATAIAYTGGSAGSALGFLIPSRVVKCGEKEDPGY